MLMGDSKSSSCMLALTCVVACTAGGDGGGFPGYPTGPGGGKNEAIEDSGSSEASDEDSSGDEAHEDSDDGAVESTGVDDDEETGDPDPSTSAGPDDGPADTGVDPPDDPGPGQPAMGLWAQCTMDAFDNCTFAAPVCISGEFDNGVEDGFCSTDICANPAVDCQPVPVDSDATPICVEARDPMNAPVFLCALGCAQGETCPAGMSCIEGISFGEDLPIYSFCV
jgi:hypothetical protein